MFGKKRQQARPNLPAEPVEEIRHASTVARRRATYIGPRTGGLLVRKDEKRLMLVPRTPSVTAL